MTLVSTPSGRALRSWVPFRYSRLLIALTLGVAAFACTPHDNGVATDFTIAFTTTPPTSAAPGSTGTIDITVTRSSGYTAGVTISFDQGQSVTGSVDVPSGQTVGHLPFAVASSAPVGPLEWTLSGTADNSGGSEATALDWNTTILQAGSFAIQHVSGVGFTIAPGASVLDTLAIARQGFPQSIAFTGSAPTGLTVTFAPSATTGNQVIATITAAANAPITPVGTSLSIVMTGTSGTTVVNAPQFSVSVANDTYSFTATPPAAPIAAGGSGIGSFVVTSTVSGIGTFNLTGTGAGGITVAAVGSLLAGTHSYDLPITVPAGTAPGTYVINLVGTTQGQLPKTASVSVVVAPPASYTLAAQTVPLNIVAGTSQPDVINIARTNFTGAVTVSGTSDQGITVTPSAASTGISATVTVNVPLTATVGTHTVTLTGTAAGLTNVPATFAVAVSAAPSNNTTWSFCPTSGLPLWVAVQDGTNAWTQVTGTGNSYPFAISSAKGGIAYVLLNSGTTELHIFYGSQAQMQTQGGALCAGGTGSAKSIGGVAVNGGTAVTAKFALGSSIASVSSFPGTFQLNNVPPGTLDLVAASLDGAAPPNAVRMLLQRNLNLATGSNLGALDFAAAGFLPTISTLAVSAPGQTVIVTYNLHTANNPLSPYYSTIVSGTSIPLFGVPVGQQVAGDLHYVVAQALSGSTDVRFAGAAFGTIAAKTLNFGSALTPTPVPSSLAPTPYARLRMVVTTQPEYNMFFDVGYQQSGPNHSVDIQTTTAYAGAVSSLNVDIPDFTAVAGWTNSWAPITGSATSWLVTVSSWTGAGGIISVPLVEGATFTSASKQGSFTP